MRVLSTSFVRLPRNTTQPARPTPPQVDTSRYWFNYRHATNALAVYDALRANGVPDSHILLMVADVAGSDARNPDPGTMHAHPTHRTTSRPHSHFTGPDGGVFGPQSEVDVRGEGVTVDAFLAALTRPRFRPHSWGSTTLGPGKDSKVVVYLTGHGGEGFLKFHDVDELTGVELGRAVAEMSAKGAYGELLLVLDTCQAQSFFTDIDSPNVTAISSSRLGENSYAAPADLSLGVSTIDRFTRALVSFLNRPRTQSTAASAPTAKRQKAAKAGRGGQERSLKALQRAFSPRELYSHASLDQFRASRGPERMRVDEFFATDPPVVAVVHVPLNREGPGAEEARPHRTDPTTNGPDPIGVCRHCPIVTLGAFGAHRGVVGEGAGAEGTTATSTTTTSFPSLAVSNTPFLHAALGQATPEVAGAAVCYAMYVAALVGWGMSWLLHPNR